MSRWSPWRLSTAAGRAIPALGWISQRGWSERLTRSLPPRYEGPSANGARAQELRALLAGPRPLRRSGRGRHFDLDALAAELAAAWMPGMPVPNATWAQLPTRRKLAHYDAIADEIVVSPTLDDARVPEYVMRFVVYHELLHKAIGVRSVNGRRRVHTAAFRRAESRFPNAASARTFLSRMDEHLDL